MTKEECLQQIFKSKQNLFDVKAKHMLLEFTLNKKIKELAEERKKESLGIFLTYQAKQAHEVSVQRRIAKDLKDKPTQEEVEWAKKTMLEKGLPEDWQKTMQKNKKAMDIIRRHNNVK